MGRLGCCCWWDVVLGFGKHGFELDERLRLLRRQVIEVAREPISGGHGRKLAIRGSAASSRAAARAYWGKTRGWRHPGVESGEGRAKRVARARIRKPGAKSITSATFVIGEGGKKFSFSSI